MLAMVDKRTQVLDPEGQQLRQIHRHACETTVRQGSERQHAGFLDEGGLVVVRVRGEET